jgi:hypothetical protein
MRDRRESSRSSRGSTTARDEDGINFAVLVVWWLSRGTWRVASLWVITVVIFNHIDYLFNHIYIYNTLTSSLFGAHVAQTSRTPAMALPRQLQPSLTPDELAFLAEEDVVDIVPLFSMTKVRLLSVSRRQRSEEGRSEEWR